MAKKVPEADYSDEEAEARATDALRRALTTPYKPQNQMKIGAKNNKRKRGRKRASGDGKI